MQRLNDNNILFITTSRFTPWLTWCEKSVKHFFPNSFHVVIDGTKNWPHVWFEWIDKLKKYDAKYFVMLDEDCFLLQREGVIDALCDMIDKEATLSGVPDCHFVWRGFNEVALNPFFMFGDKQKLLDVIERNPYYKQLRFNPKYFGTLKYDWDVQFKNVGLEYEPFYCLFWAVLEAGQKLNYLYPSDNYGFANRDNKLPATCPRVSPDGPDLALHMWYSRQWNDHQNFDRYEKLQKFLSTFL